MVNLQFALQKLPLKMIPRELEPQREIYKTFLNRWVLEVKLLISQEVLL